MKRIKECKGMLKSADLAACVRGSRREIVIESIEIEIEIVVISIDFEIEREIDRRSQSTSKTIETKTMS